jgi:hypothetical protein
MTLRTAGSRERSVARCLQLGLKRQAPILLRTLLVLALSAVAGCAEGPAAVQRMDAMRIQQISDYRLCDAAAVSLDLQGRHYPVIDEEIARRGISCDEHIAAVVSDCSALQVLSWGADRTGQGIIFTVRNGSGQAKNFRVRRQERQSRLFAIGPGETTQFGITADPNVMELGPPTETIEGAGGIQFLECRPVVGAYHINYRPQAQSSPRGSAATAAVTQLHRAKQGLTSRAMRNANARAGPGTSHAIVGALRAGDEITVLGVQGRWCDYMTNSGRRAYVSCASLSPPSGGWIPLSAAAPENRGLSPPAAFPRGYDAAYASYLSLLSPQQRTVPWLARMEGVVSSAQPIALGGSSALWLSSCMPHDCYNNQVVLFLMPDRRSVRAVLRMNGEQQLLAGAGAAEAACVRDLFNSGWTIKTCGRSAPRLRPAKR